MLNFNVYIALKNISSTKIVTFFSYRNVKQKDHNFIFILYIYLYSVFESSRIKLVFVITFESQTTEVFIFQV